MDGAQGHGSERRLPHERRGVGDQRELTEPHGGVGSVRRFEALLQMSLDVLAGAVPRGPARLLQGRDPAEQRRQLRRRRHLGAPLARRRLITRRREGLRQRDRKSTRLNSSHVKISYAAFCLKKKTK